MCVDKLCGAVELCNRTEQNRTASCCVRSGGPPRYRDRCAAPVSTRSVGWSRVSAALLVSSRLVSSHLVSSLLVSSRLVSSLLFSSLLFSSFCFLCLSFPSRLSSFGFLFLGVPFAVLPLFFCARALLLLLCALGLVPRLSSALVFVRLGVLYHFPLCACSRARCATVGAAAQPQFSPLPIGRRRVQSSSSRTAMRALLGLPAAPSPPVNNNYVSFQACACSGRGLAPARGAASRARGASKFLVCGHCAARAPSARRGCPPAACLPSLLIQRTKASACRGPSAGRLP